MAHELDRAALWQLADWLRSKRISPVEILEHSLPAIEGEQLSAFIAVYADEAMAAARKAESEIARGQYRGPLHGIPVAVKDNISMRGKVTTMGSRIHSDFIPRENAHIVDGLESAGAVIVGKTNLHEYALGVTTENPHYGDAKNPWDTERTTGGSSGGSAAAVAGGLVPVAIGSDTSGSIRIPASACGLLGLKPTYGRLSRRGCFPEAWSLDHLGFLTHNARDAAIMLDALSGHDPRDQGSLPLPATDCARSMTDKVRGVRIGVEEDFYFGRVDASIEDVVRSAIAGLEERGASVHPVRVPELRSAEYALTIIDSVEFTSVHEENLRTRPQDFGDDVRRLLGTGALPSGIDYVQAQQLRARVAQGMARVFSEVDVLVAPTLPVRTPRIGDRFARLHDTDWDIFDALVKHMGPANLAGLPAVSVPCGLVDGLPVGLQILGPALGETRVLSVASAVEATDPLGGAVPPGAFMGRL